MDGHLVFEVHLVKLVDAAHTLETKRTCHQSRRMQTIAPPIWCFFCLPKLTLSASIRAPASMTNSCDSSSRTTAAVRPAALLAFPLVYTALGLNSSTCLNTHTQDLNTQPDRQLWDSHTFTTLQQDLLKELTLGRARVSHDANVDVSSEGRSLHGGLGNAPEQHQQDAALHLVVACGITDSV